LPFPAYCPELNPVEKLWDQVKREVSNAVWKTPENILEKRKVSSADIHFNIGINEIIKQRKTI
jgi:transposase